jgi:2,4-dienoyl-CoA reductase (NADPH2)
VASVFDVAELVSHEGPSAALDRQVFAREWGVDFENHPRGGVAGVVPEVARADREVFLLQRKPTSPGRGLGPTTGWAHKLALKRRGVHMLRGVRYDRIDDNGLHITIDDEPRLLPVDTVILCAGQESERGLFDALTARRDSVYLIGGADVAAEIGRQARHRPGLPPGRGAIAYRDSASGQRIGTDRGAELPPPRVAAAS